MKTLSIILLVLFALSSNAWCLVASDIDMQPAISDLTVVVMSILSFLVLLLGYKKTMSLLGR